jgi:putative ABC transport system permease protein
MNDIFYMAWKYLQFNKAKTLVLIGSISLILFLPAGLFVTVEQGGSKLTARAESTPILIGPKGSSSDLTLNALYFRKPALETISFSEVSKVSETGLAYGIPLNLRYTVEEFSIVGTTLEYFDYRDLAVAQGRQFGMLGECVVGANVADAMSLTVGDHVFSTPAGAFDVAGTFPLKMPVVGILEPAGNADDNAVFADVKTAWIISGLAHGHQNITDATDERSVIEKDEQNIVVNASVLSYTEITPDNLDSFHFHGSPDDFPIDAVIVIPNDKKSGILLRGRYQETGSSIQMIVPLKVINDLLNTVFVVRDYVILAGAGVAIAAFCVMSLVFMLSVRMRKREIETIKKIGGAIQRLKGILSTEIILVIFSGIVLAALFTGIISLFGELLIQII